MDLAPFLRCSRTGNGDWRCKSIVAPGRSYCARHYAEQKVRHERKLFLLSNKKKGSDEEDLEEGEGEGEVSEEEAEATERENCAEDGCLIGSRRKKIEKQNCGDQEGRGRGGE